MMSTDIQIFTNQEFNKDIRAIEINGEPWFVGNDIAEALGYARPRDAVKDHVPDKYKKVLTPQQMASVSKSGDSSLCDSPRGLTFINEAGLYKLVMRSRLPNAERFSDWCCEEVLPQLRKTGSYRIGDKVPQTFLEALELATKLERERVALEESYRAEQERADNAEREAKANQDAKDLQDHATKRRIGYDLGKAAKFLNVQDLGRNRLFKFLRDNGDFFYDRNGYNSVKQSHVNQKRFFEYIDETYEYPVIYISPKGMRYVLKALINAGYKPQITAEEWERKCQLDQEEEEE